MNKPTLTYHWITAWNKVSPLCSKTSSFSSFPDWNTESLHSFVCACLRCRTTEWGSACLYPVWFETKYPKHLMWLCLDTSSQWIFSSSLEYWPWKCLVNDPSNHFFSLCIVCVPPLSWIFPLWPPSGELCMMIQLHYGGKYDKPASPPISVCPLCFQPGVRCLQVHSESGSPEQ